MAGVLELVQIPPQTVAPPVEMGDSDRTHLESTVGSHACREYNSRATDYMLGTRGTRPPGGGRRGKLGLVRDPHPQLGRAWPQLIQWSFWVVPGGAGHPGGLMASPAFSTFVISGEQNQPGGPSWEREGRFHRGQRHAPQGRRQTSTAMESGGPPLALNSPAESWLRPGLLQGLGPPPG